MHYLGILREIILQYKGIFLPDIWEGLETGDQHLNILNILS